MGTRSLTAILNEDGKEIFTMYNQYDGYASGYGLDLAKFLSEFTITNGISHNNTSVKKKIANGMECLSGQIVAHFKICVGGVYLYPPNTRKMGDEYLYIISLFDSNIMMKLLKYKDELYEEVFYGTPEEFIIRFK